MNIFFRFVFILSLFLFNGCDSGGGVVGDYIDDKRDDGNDNNQEQTITTEYTDVIVEKAAVYDSVVEDSAGNIAYQLGDSSTYRFSVVPTYPITATGGYMDINNDKVINSYDAILDINLSSYTNNLTTVSTYLASIDDTSNREDALTTLAGLFETTTNELLKTPFTTTDENAIKAFAALYVAIKENNKEANATIDQITTSKIAVTNAITLDGNETLEDIAVKYEEQIVKDTTNTISDDIGLPNIETSEDSIVILQGNQISMDINITDNNSTKTIVNSFDTDVAVASATDNALLIQAIGEGSTYIILTAIDDSNHIASKSIYVTVTTDSNSTNNEKPSLTLSPSSDFDVDLNQTITLLITATDTDGTISLLNVIPNFNNDYAAISVSKSGIGTSEANAVVEITGVSIGNFDIHATTLDSGGETTTAQLNINIIDTSEPVVDTNTTQDAIYDAQACVVSNGYTM
ncbi:MAG: hypothetical protein U9O56_03550, partial [Campylobacterota bacterium]|nr:hypothetical protein [Campylobacterota bacterium]